VDNASDNSVRPLSAVILAAGMGTRMDSDGPKVACAVAGRPMIRWVVEAVREAGAKPIVLVIGHGAERVREVFDGDDEDLAWAIQDRQLGTGHATRCAGEALAGFSGDVLVLAGDGPLIRPETIQTLVDHHRRHHAAVTLATSTVDDPTGYGRVIRNADGRFEAIVEHASATETQRRVREIYPSYACYDAQLLFALLARLDPDETSGEYRITDVPAMARAAGHSVELVDGFPPQETLSINTAEQLEMVEGILSQRVQEATR
jgi:bifunctional UDP-N-acetylglucosamine pyrophosphorylase/glucosamine-1-phosphate N-acetyltransferase